MTLLLRLPLSRGDFRGSWLNLPTLSTPAATILGLNGAIAANSTKICSVSLSSSTDPEFYTETDAYVVEQLAGRLPTERRNPCFGSQMLSYGSIIESKRIFGNYVDRREKRP